MDRPLQVGITGGIGTGKSLVSRIFNCLGAPVYDADRQAKKLMTSDGILIEQIKKEFGTSSYRKDGSLDTFYLSKATFGDQKKLEKLNLLVHPRVAYDYHQWVEAQNDHKYVLREAALLYEAGIYTSIDKMIVISSTLEIRMKRIMARDPQRTEEDIKAIMKSQWSEEEKIKRADFIIYNDDRQLIIPQVLKLHALFIS